MAKAKREKKRWQTVHLSSGGEYRGLIIGSAYTKGEFRAWVKSVLNIPRSGRLPVGYKIEEVEQVPAQSPGV